MKSDRTATATYFGCQVFVTCNPSFENHPLPWRYEIITPSGQHLIFVGIPNQLHSKRSALKKAWWRAKQIAEGTYGSDNVSPPEKRIVIYIDMDETLCDYIAHYDVMKRNHPEVDYPQSIEGFFTGIPPLPEAVETFRWLFDHPSTDVSILTAPSLKNLHCYSEKALWVTKHLGEDVLPKLIISNEKHKNIGDYLIDDRLNGRGQERFQGEQIHFGSRQFPDWRAIRTFFEQMLS